MFYRIVRALLVPIFKLYYRPLIRGKQNTEIRGPAIVICNHVSLGDPLLLAVLFKRTLHFMSKAELFRIKPLAALLRALNAFPVDRDISDVTSVKNALQVLKDGHVFAIFPEGTRNKAHKLLPLHRGFAFIALKANVPVVPVLTCVRGMRRYACIGEHIDLGAELSGIPRHKRTEAAVTVIQAKMQEIMDLL